MIHIDNKRLCTGCGACGNVCPTGAIEYRFDDEGFKYPEVMLEKCIGCNRCENVCPMLDAGHGVPDCNKIFDAEFYAGQLTDKSVLNQVSSGGIFYGLAETIIKSGGVIYGVVQKNVDEISHIRAENNEDIDKIRRSKYLQSDVGSCYKSAIEDLNEGRTVLFSGTGCQIAGLNQMTGEKYKNLITCEVVCHGVPSQKAWNSYRKETEEKKCSKMTELIFRDKSAGWQNNQYRTTYENGESVAEDSTEHMFHSGYLQGLFYRPACGLCPFASIPRGADISLADYWQYAGKLFSETSANGVSLICVNSEKGKKLVELASHLKFIQVEPTTREKALDSCRHLWNHPYENPNRKAFFRDLKKNGYYSAAHKYIVTGKESISRKVIRRVRKIIRNLKEPMFR